MTKTINMEWAQSLLGDSGRDQDSSRASRNIDWVQANKNFSESIKFKVMPANSKENNIFAHKVATHWNLGPNKDRRIVCCEQTEHLKNLGYTCPVCEAKRRLRAAGFSEEDLSYQGKYGLESLFDPRVTTNVKVVVTESDMKKDWDGAHISMLQQNGIQLARWLVEQYVNADVPDFLDLKSSNLLTISRQAAGAKWDRNVGFATFAPSEEVMMRLREENEALVVAEVWPMPSDKDFLEIKTLMAETMLEYKAAKDALAETMNKVFDNGPSASVSEPVAPVTQETSSSFLDDDIPF